MRYSTVSALGALSAINTTGDAWILVPNRCSGGADADFRPVVEDKPGADGVDVYDGFDSLQVITLGGYLQITSSATQSGYFSALDTLFASIKSAINGMKTSSGNLVHSGGTLAVQKYGRIETEFDAALMYVIGSVVVVP